jgi:ssDNA-binding Zn-finger/Zn-ribbon topoisomerase 1
MNLRNPLARFTNTVQNPQFKLNKQNEHIAHSFDTVNFVLTALMKMGITVLSVQIEKNTPEIRVLECPNCEKLDEYKTGKARRHPNDAFIQYVTYKKCLIAWLTKIH